MNSLQLILRHPATIALGWTLVHFLWQGALIAGLYGLADLALGKARATTRYGLASLAMLSMLAACAATFFWIQGPPAASLPQAVLGATPVLPAVLPLAAPAASAGLVASEKLAAALPWLVCAWFAGVVVLSIRSAGGWMVARRLQRTGACPADAHLLRMLDRLARSLGVHRTVSLMESAAAKVPGVVGWLRPVILLPASTLAGLTPQMLEAVLAHELAHVRRRDYLVNLLQTAVETLLFYHPAVWWLGKKIREERENCCDDLAVAACGDALAYARALTEMEQLRADGFQLVMASTGGSLLARIRRLLGVSQAGGQAFPASIAGIAAVAGLFAVWGLAQVSISNHRDTSETRSESAGAGSVEGAQAVPSGAGSERPSPMPAPSSTGFIGGLAAAGYKNLSVDQLIQLKIHGVTPEFIRQIEAAGLGHPDPDELVSMRIHDVTPEYVNELKAVGCGGLDVDELVSFKIHGVTPEHVKQLRALWGKLTPDDLVSAQIHGVTPEYAREIKNLSLGDPSFDDAVSMKIHGVTPEFANSMKALGIKGLNLDELTAFKIHGVDPAQVRELQKLGFSALSADDVVAMQIHGVTAEFVHSLEQAGLAHLSLDDALAARIHGVTREFIQELSQHGFNKLGIDQIIELKRLNILDSSEKGGK